VAGLCHHRLPSSPASEVPQGVGQPLVLPAGDHSFSGQACLGAHCSSPQGHFEETGPGESEATVLYRSSCV